MARSNTTAGERMLHKKSTQRRSGRRWFASAAVFSATTLLITVPNSVSASHHSVSGSQAGSHRRYRYASTNKKALFGLAAHKIRGGSSNSNSPGNTNDLDDEDLDEYIEFLLAAADNQVSEEENPLLKRYLSAETQVPEQTEEQPVVEIEDSQASMESATVGSDEPLVEPDVPVAEDPPTVEVEGAPVLSASPDPEDLKPMVDDENDSQQLDQMIDTLVATVDDGDEVSSTPPALQPNDELEPQLKQSADSETNDKSTDDQATAEVFAVAIDPEVVPLEDVVPIEDVVPVADKIFPSLDVTVDESAVATALKENIGGKHSFAPSMDAKVDDDMGQVADASPSTPEPAVPPVVAESTPDSDDVANEDQSAEFFLGPPAVEEVPPFVEEAMTETEDIDKSDDQKTPVEEITKAYETSKVEESMAAANQAAMEASARLLESFQECPPTYEDYYQAEDKAQGEQEAEILQDLSSRPEVPVISAENFRPSAAELATRAAVQASREFLNEQANSPTTYEDYYAAEDKAIADMEAKIQATLASRPPVPAASPENFRWAPMDAATRAAARKSREFLEAYNQNRPSYEDYYEAEDKARAELEAAVRARLAATSTIPVVTANSFTLPPKPVISTFSSSVSTTAGQDDIDSPTTSMEKENLQGTLLRYSKAWGVFTAKMMGIDTPQVDQPQEQGTDRDYDLVHEKCFVESEAYNSNPEVGTGSEQDSQDANMSSGVWDSLKSSITFFSSLGKEADSKTTVDTSTDAALADLNVEAKENHETEEDTISHEDEPEEVEPTTLEESTSPTDPTRTEPKTLESLQETEELEIQGNTDDVDTGLDSSEEDFSRDDAFEDGGDILVDELGVDETNIELDEIMEEDEVLVEPGLDAAIFDEEIYVDADVDIDSEEENDVESSQIPIEQATLASSTELHVDDIQDLNFLYRSLILRGFEPWLMIIILFTEWVKVYLSPIKDVAIGLFSKRTNSVPIDKLREQLISKLRGGSQVEEEEAAEEELPLKGVDEDAAGATEEEKSEEKTNGEFAPDQVKSQTEKGLAPSRAPRRPNLFYRLLLGYGQIGHILILECIIAHEWAKIYLPILESFISATVEKVFPSIAGSIHETDAPLSQTTGFVSADGSAVRGGKKKKSETRKADQKALSQLQRVGNISQARYKFLSDSFMQRHGLGDYATPEHELGNDIIVEGTNKKKSRKSKRKKVSIEEDPESDAEWITSALEVGDSVGRDEDLGISMDSSVGVAIGGKGASVTVGFELGVGSKRSGKNNASIADVAGRGSISAKRKVSGQRVSDKESGVMGRIRAAGASSIVGRSILGAYPGDVPPPTEAADRTGLLDLASRYGYGDWSDMSDFDEFSDDESIEAQAAGKSKRSKRRRRNADVQTSTATRTKRTKRRRRAPRPRSEDVFDVESVLGTASMKPKSPSTNSRRQRTGVATSPKGELNDAKSDSVAASKSNPLESSKNEPSNPKQVLEDSKPMNRLNKVKEDSKATLTKSSASASLKKALDEKNSESADNDN